MKTEWKIEEIRQIYHKPLFELLSEAHHLHKKFHPIDEVQVCHVISFKTGGCQENCRYCTQSSYYETEVSPQPLMKKEEILERVRFAASKGATRVCLAAGWRELKEGKPLETLLETIREIKTLNIEVCCTLGMLKPHLAQKLKEAGVHSYNHNIDTSREYYPQVVTTRTFDDRLQTLEVVREAGMKVCCGAILGMGESEEDHISLIHTLATRSPQPDSVPVNILMPMKGTPFEHTPPLPVWTFIRTIATVRLTIPQAFIRITGGRFKLSWQEHALAFFAGANSIHSGDGTQFLTKAGSLQTFDQDEEMFRCFGLKKREAFTQEGGA